MTDTCTSDNSKSHTFTSNTRSAANMKRKRTHRTIRTLLKIVLKCFCSYIEREGFHLTWSQYQDLTQYTTPL